MHESEDRPAVSPAITPSRHLPAHPRGWLTWRVSSEVWRGSERKCSSRLLTPRKEVGRTAIETEEAYDPGTRRENLNRARDALGWAQCPTRPGLTYQTCGWIARCILDDSTNHRVVQRPTAPSP